MHFAGTPLGVGPRRVEIAQEGGFQSIGRVVAREDLFQHVFGIAVGIHRVFRVGFVHRHLHRIAIDGAGGGEDEILRLRGNHDVEEVHGVVEVVMVVLGGIDHRFAHVDVGCEMHDGQWLVFLKGRADGGGVFKVALHQRTTLDRPGVPLGEVVESDGVEALGFRGQHGVRADIPGAAGDEKGFVRQREPPEIVAVKRCVCNRFKIAESARLGTQN